VASFGLTEQAASDKYGENAVSVSFRPLAKIDRAICEGTGDHGFIKIVYKTRTKQILGATIMSPAAGELVSELSAVQAAKMPFDKLATVMHSYPSYSIALQQMAAEVYYDKLKKGKALYDVLKKAGL
jgi:pyruvate/2-oxoglutarate dehydrogenase complex dihydrolipoamide dehydrogenase (E3) component